MTVVKIIELIGSSPKSWEDATKNALAEAKDNIKSVYVKRATKVENNKKDLLFQLKVTLRYTKPKKVIDDKVICR